MGSSKLQAWIISLIASFLNRVLDMRKYAVLFNEVGFYVSPRSWRNLDIAIFDREALLAEGITDEYTRVPPLVVIEVDTKADLGRYGGEMEWYMREKVDDLLKAGVARVIWYTTKDRRVLVAQPDQPWRLMPWDEPVELLDDVTLRLGDLLAEAEEA